MKCLRVLNCPKQQGLKHMTKAHMCLMCEHLCWDSQTYYSLHVVNKESLFTTLGWIQSQRHRIIGSLLTQFVQISCDYKETWYKSEWYEWRISLKISCFHLSVVNTSIQGNTLFSSTKAMYISWDIGVQEVRHARDVWQWKVCEIEVYGCM